MMMMMMMMMLSKMIAPCLDRLQEAPFLVVVEKFMAMMTALRWVGS